VGNGSTGHAEAVLVTYNPSVVRYDQLLQILFSVGADPTQLNRQGPDRGSQYRSAIVPMSAEQRAVATAYLAQMRRSGVWDDPIVVAIENHQRFYPAEDYHQDFLLHNPDNPYIVRWDQPKVAALRTMFPRLWRATYRPG
jgi:peptide-methionine (S)-S-oxide reductase